MALLSRTRTRRRVLEGPRLAAMVRLRRDRGVGERGASLVETAIAMPFLVLMMFGALEFGYLFMHSVSIANSIATGGRAGSSTGVTVVEDQRIIEQLKSRKLALTGARYIVIYKASSADGKAPAQCINGSSVSGVCNVYSVSPTGVVTGSDSAWPATARFPGTDYLGVAIVATHNWLSGLFPDAVRLTDSSAVLIEPVVSAVGPSTGAVANGEGPRWGTDTNPNAAAGGLPIGPSHYTTFWASNLEPQGTGGGDQGGGGTTQY